MREGDAGVAWRLFGFNWWLVALLGCSLAWAVFHQGLLLEPIAFGATIAVASALAAISYFSVWASGTSADPKFVFSLGVVAQVIVITALAGPLSYAVNSFNWPLQDHALLQMDVALGLDPRRIATFVNDNGWLASFLDIGYSLIKWPLLGIPVILALTSRLVRLQQFMSALIVALVVTIAISALMPAIGTYYGLRVAPETAFPNVHASNYAKQLHDIMALRDGSMRELELFKLGGIVSFPSFHAASAVLYLWALWPVREVRWVAVLLNVWMMIATPVVGAHYCVDIFGGIAVAAGAISAAGLITRYWISPGNSPARDPSTVAAALRYENGN